jgi:hypothetical protein
MKSHEEIHRDLLQDQLGLICERSILSAHFQVHLVRLRTLLTPGIHSMISMLTVWRPSLAQFLNAPEGTFTRT